MKHSSLCAAVAAALCFTGLASANMITIDSVAGMTTSMSGINTVAITPHPAWEGQNPVNPGDPTDTSAVWISYADTGFGGLTFQPYMGMTPVVTIYEDFTALADSKLRLNVWADDTATVKLDGTSLMDAQFTNTTCSGQPIGCVPTDVGDITANISAGSHELAFTLFQTGNGGDTTSNPFGVLFTGTVDPTPEPGTCLLVGGCLLVAGLVRRRSLSR